MGADPAELVHAGQPADDGVLPTVTSPASVATFDMITPSPTLQPCATWQ
jgi:hypothetical protein